MPPLSNVDSLRAIVGRPKKIRHVTRWQAMDNLVAILVAMKVAGIGAFSWWIPAVIFAFNGTMTTMFAKGLKALQRRAGYRVPQ